MAMGSGGTPIEPEGMLDGIQWGNVARGAVLDLAASWLALIPILLHLADIGSLEDEKAIQDAIERAALSTEFLWLSAVIGLGVSVAVAFWVARRAGDRHVLHGGWTAVGAVLLGFALTVLTGSDESRPPFWFEALGYALMIPAGMFGGWLASRAEPHAD